MTPAAWMAWVMLVMVVALATTNPLYLAILLLAVLLVAALAPRTGIGVTSFRALVVFGIAMFGISVAVATINGNYGDHILFTVPGPAIPEWLGGLRLGGPVSAEGLAAAAIRGFAILCVLFAFGVFNGAVSPHRVLRSTPAALFHASLVVTVGLTLLPSSIEDLRRIREMRALRGARGGLRDLPALVVPAVIGGLERSMRLAEAMEARGYAAAPPPPLRARLAAAGSAPLLIAAAWLWFYSDLKGAGGLCAALGFAAIAWWFWVSSRRQRTTKLSSESLPPLQKAAIAASAGIALLVLGLRLNGAANLAYNPFAGLPPVKISPVGLLVALSCAWPATFLLFEPAPVAAREPERLAAEAAR
ncbi:MAG: energy-coupling factor transporter transmembrane component T [bacterium]